MTQDKIFNFTVDKEKCAVKVERTFEAPLGLVWSAWTEAELLDQWWAPKPWKAETKTMDFTEGGRWIYAMVGPDGERHHAFMDYKAIAPRKAFTAREGFAGPDGKADDALPASTWVNTFSEKAGVTSVTNDIRFADLAQLETLLKMGFKEGYTMGLDNLEELLARIQKESK